MRDLDEKPYSPCEARVAKYFSDTMGIGGGDDPIAFIIASHMALADDRRELKLRLAAERKKYSDMIAAIALGAGA